MAVPIAPACAPPLPGGQQKLPTGRKEVEAQFPDAHCPGVAHLANRGRLFNDCAAAAVGAIIEAITGNATIEASPTFLIISRLDMPAK